MMRYWLALGASNGLLSVAAGAFGAHALKGRLSEEMLAVFETAARYQMYHALALLAVGWLASHAPSGRIHVAGWAFLCGVVLFCGSLYALSLSGVRAFGVVTPLGGIAFLIGWGVLAWSALRPDWGAQHRTPS
ncbi:MAG: DUF423 domain-containing protein [Planctomycetes bacterium]|nr:DUF423 domain-containing protein [Planctomycetota bacterium]